MKFSIRDKANAAGPSPGEHVPPAQHEVGAGDGNRTHISSLEGWSSAIELHPHSAHQLDALLLPFLCRSFDAGRDSEALVEGVSVPPHQLPSNAVKLPADFLAATVT